jgi:antitoxin (DNA-binding transcriptional repressor) of toxin-antitoxin stability system
MTREPITFFRATELPAGQFRADMSRYLRRLEMMGDRYLVTRNGRVVAGLVTPWDVHALEEVDLRDKTERDRRLREQSNHMTWLEEAREKARRGENVEWQPRW